MLLRSCELRKNRWSERHTSLPTSLPGHYLCLSVCLSVCLSTYPSISLCIYTCLCIYLSNCMEHSPSWSQSRNSLYLMEPEGSLPHSQKPTTVPLLSRINPVHASHLISWSSILILSSHIRLGLRHVSQPKPCMYVTHSSTVRATYPTSLTLRDLITWMIPYPKAWDFALFSTFFGRFR